MEIQIQIRIGIKTVPIHITVFNAWFGVIFYPDLDPDPTFPFVSDPS
jgi:hypothetical protein